HHGRGGPHPGGGGGRGERGPRGPLRAGSIFFGATIWEGFNRTRVTVIATGFSPVAPSEPEVEERTALLTKLQAGDHPRRLRRPRLPRRRSPRP
ncbi:MAG: hypothetical protein ABDI20_04175, partial [Candidatus Bipolaricaulaceae bacterium]